MLCSQYQSIAPLASLSLSHVSLLWQLIKVSQNHGHQFDDQNLSWLMYIKHLWMTTRIESPPEVLKPVHVGKRF